MKKYDPIGFGLILTILATLLYMYFMHIPLERMSLGALIIAMVMMVDNSIVTDWRLDMMNPIRELKFNYDQKRARTVGISRENLAGALERGYSVTC